MGFLEIGEPISWEEALKHIKYVRDHGIKQFINIFTRVKVRARDELLWGDEVGAVRRCFGFAQMSFQSSCAISGFGVWSEECATLAHPGRAAHGTRLCACACRTCFAVALAAPLYISSLTFMALHARS